ncbi:MAG: dockerin type I domain-containing protein, partial [Verrucomicrobiota bacterium]
PQWGTLDVDSTGNLFIGGVNVNTNQVWCTRSSNAKNSAVTPTFDQNTAVNMGGSFNFSGPINPAGLAGQLFLGVDRSGTNLNNNIYMMASIQPTGNSNGTDVQFVKSTNGGVSFSVPKRVNDDPINQNKWHWLGTFSVAPNGRIDSVWLDTRNAANNTDSQLFYSYSIDGGDNWVPSVAVSNSFNPFLGYPQQNKMGDYITMVADNTGSNVAYTATFNGEEDIYYVRVGPPAPAASSAVSRKMHGGAGNFDVNLPLSGTPGVECRSGGATNDYQMVVIFPTSVSVVGNPQAQVTSGTGMVGTGGVANGGMVTVSGSTVTVPLTNVASAQTINVTLFGVNRAGNIVIPMSVLVGDTSSNAVVNATDVAQTKSQIGQPVNASNFRTDVNANGAINATDAGLVKMNIGTGL